MIAAKLNHNPQYSKVEELYRGYLNKFANEDECNNYERLVAYLNIMVAIKNGVLYEY
ncbi:MAG: hypothetical protein R2822_28560 [Spirosomataceae bacterium]